jgi:myo-inositol-1(or 4)-monophosphatase
MSAPSPADLLACALEVARAAGRHALENRHRRHEVAQAFRHDVKLVLDMECQRRAESVILGAYPDHAILGEEGGAGASDGRPVWVVDPIDGTVNFSHGLPYWCTSIAAQVGGRTVAGVVYAPVLGDVFAATVDGPATCNGERLAVSDTADLAGALALTGLAKTFDTDQGALAVTRAVAEKVQKVRLLGAAALDICQVAAGHAEAFFESGLYPWDALAGVLIVERAGGQAEVLEQVDALRRAYLISNGRLHGALREVIMGARALPRGSKPSP